MIREIRRVPLDWQHPKDEQGAYIPLLPEDFDWGAQQWLRGLRQWIKEEYDSRRPTFTYYWEQKGMPPIRAHYRPQWIADPVGYQVYEVDSRGTPFGPVCETLDKLHAWLVAQGESETAIVQLIEWGVRRKSGRAYFEVLSVDHALGWVEFLIDGHYGLARLQKAPGSDGICGGRVIALMLSSAECWEGYEDLIYWLDHVDRTPPGLLDKVLDRLGEIVA